MILPAEPERPYSHDTSPPTSSPLAKAEREITLLQSELREQINESTALRDLAHAMAESPDTSSLLAILAESANQQCHAEATFVTRADESTVTVIAAVAEQQPLTAFLRDWQFPLAGTLTERVVREQRVIVRTDLTDVLATLPADHLLRTMSNGQGAGPIMLAPLMAHTELLGVLTSIRAADASPFSVRDERRLRVIADHAAVALKKSELFEAVASANQAKNTFLTTISHELRTPLTALAGYSELLADEILGPLSNAQQDTVGRMHAATTQLTVMIDEILSYTSLESGLDRLVVTTFDPGQLLREIASVVEPMARMKGLDFAAETETPLRSLTSDAAKIRHVLVNLCDNAVKFTPNGGRVRLRASDDGRAVTFVVEDTGIGIAPDQIGKLFQPFMQLDAGLTRRYGGAGLGLHISRRLAERVGGTIDVDSIPSVGSTFRVTIPH